jgi:hypothetical protein
MADGLRPERLRRMENLRKPEEREALRRELRIDDVRELLGTDAGKRVFGSIFEFCGLHEPSGLVREHALLAYQTGMRDAANMIANTIREADPRLVAECEVAHAEFERMFADLATCEEEEG